MISANQQYGLAVDWAALGAAVVRGLSDVGGFLSAAIVPVLDFLFDARASLAFGPLVTINAIGVGMMLFALDQLLQNLGRRAQSTFEHKQFKYLRLALGAMSLAGIIHLVSVMLVLVGRFGCESNCPTTSDSALLAWATNLTIVGMLIVMWGSVRAFWGFINLSDKAPPPPGTMPTIMGNPAAS